MRSSDVIKTHKSYIRYDKFIGLFVFSCETGLIYVYHEKYFSAEQTIDNEEIFPKLEVFISSLLKQSGDEMRLLPHAKDWTGLEKLKLTRPITINWLITNECTHCCRYCYASDVQVEKVFFSDEDLDSVAKKILHFAPLNVVISGGEPFLHERMPYIISLFSGKSGVTIDTNGFFPERIQAMIPILKNSGAIVRVSIDDLRIDVEAKTRESKSKRLSKEERVRLPLESIMILKKNNIPFVIHTVVTKRNANDLVGMGDKLAKLGVKNWRLFEMQIPSQKVDFVRNSGLYFVNPGKKQSDQEIVEAYEKKYLYFCQELKVKQKQRWPQIVLSFTRAQGAKNNVILIFPNGEWYVEGEHGSGKRLLDLQSPVLDIDWGEHFKRYTDSIEKRKAE